MPVSPSLQRTMTVCAHSYRRFATVLDNEDRGRVRLDEVIARWRDHYLGEFAEFDRTLMGETHAGRRPPDQLLAVSVTHHNLHRLIEVLELEIGSAPLSTSKVPERILDLVEVVARLEGLLQSGTSSTARQEHDYA